MKNKKNIVLILIAIALISFGVIYFSKTNSESKISTKINLLPKKANPLPVQVESLSKIKSTLKVSQFLNASLSIENTKYELDFLDGENIYDAMVRLKDAKKITFEAKQYAGIGEFIKSVEGKESGGGHYWIYYINGKKADVGVSAYKLKIGDSIAWKFEESIN